MEPFLFLSALGAFFLLPAAAPVVLRCGLAACLRFSPRAALALSSCAALSGCAAMLSCRGGLRGVTLLQRLPVAAAAFLGGTLGRMLLLMFTARFSGSLSLSRVQAAPLLLLVLVGMFPRKLRLPCAPSGLFAFSLLCAFAEGFLGCGGTAHFLLAGRSGVCRRPASPSGAALLLGFIAQLSALLLTHLSGAAEIFPARLPLSLAAAAALGSVFFEKTKKRAGIQRGLRIALCMYMVFAALAGIEQSFLD